MKAMTKRIQLLSMLAGAALLAAGQAWGDSAPDAFALRLYSTLAAGPEPAENLVLSPYGIAQALALAAAGAQGQTAAQILSAVVPEGVADVPGYFALKNGDWMAQAAAGGGHLGVANGIWTAAGAPPAESFAALARAAYHAETAPLDFGHPDVAADYLNAWVRDRTEGLIPRLLSPDDLAGSPPIVLINAIAFQGFWKHPFTPEDTAPRPFTLADGTPGTAPMMAQLARFSIADLPDMQLLRLPYAGEEIEMRVVLPRKGTSLADLERRLETEWEAWADAAESRQVDVQLPRFDAAWGPSDLHRALVALGIEHAFDERADFSPMGAGMLPGMPLAYVLHAARVQVDETGTKAAAATAIATLKSIRRPVPPVVFHADHPFLYAITEAASGSILFIGRLDRPDGFTPDASAMPSTAEPSAESDATSEAAAPAAEPAPAPDASDLSSPAPAEPDANPEVLSPVVAPATPLSEPSTPSPTLEVSP